MKTFTDTSIFQGVKQYYDESGAEWRQIRNGFFTDFYSDNGEKNGFHYQGNLARAAKRSIFDLHRAFLDQA